MTRIRTGLWRAGAPVRWILISLIRGYRLVFAGALSGHCRFYPSCSHYAEDAIRAHGTLRGLPLSVWRVLRCNPFGRGGLDPVPERAALHDAVIRIASEMAEA